MSDLQKKLDELVAEHGVPGVAVGVLADGEEHYAVAGVTSVAHPLPVDEETLFQFGSTGKTYTATAIMRLVAQGKVELDAPVRRYIPELKLKDESVAERVTVLQLLNHTAGWSGDVMTDTGRGDDALEKYVTQLAEVEQVTPLGEAVSYNNAALSVAGRLIEKVTGTTYEQAMKDLVLEPLGMTSTEFFPEIIMTKKFVAGHQKQPDGSHEVVGYWSLPRGGSPAGGMSSDIRDQLRWAKFHLGDGRAEDGTEVLPAELVKQMQEPTVDMRGSALGDYVGISWLIREVDGTRLVGHGGTTNGHHSSFVMAPERGVAVAVLTNSGPDGPALYGELQKWALEHYAGVRDVTPEAVLLGDAELAQYIGTYETVAVVVEITSGEGVLQATARIKPEALAELKMEEQPEQPPIPLGILPGGDQFVGQGEEAGGMRGYFRRDADGKVDAVHLGGRLAVRTA